MPASPKIVVTGFEAFGHAAENPTLAVLAQLRTAKDVAGDLTTIELPVDSGRIAAILDAKLDALRPDIWIGLGLAAGLAVVAVERIAANVMDFPIPDNAGVRHEGRPVFDPGPAAYLATLPVRSIVSGLRAAGVPAKVSNSAATFVCNQMMYTLLHLVAAKGLATRAGFIHVPAHPAYAARQDRPGAEMPSMSIDLMTAAVKHAIATTVAVAQDHGKPGLTS